MRTFLGLALIVSGLVIVQAAFHLTSLQAVGIALIVAVLYSEARTAAESRG